MYVLIDNYYTESNINTSTEWNFDNGSSQNRGLPVRDYYNNWNSGTTLDYSLSEYKLMKTIIMNLRFRF